MVAACEQPAVRTQVTALSGYNSGGVGLVSCCLLFFEHGCRYRGLIPVRMWCMSDQE